MNLAASNPRPVECLDLGASLDFWIERTRRESEQAAFARKRDAEIEALRLALVQVGPELNEIARLRKLLAERNEDVEALQAQVNRLRAQLEKTGRDKS